MRLFSLIIRILNTTLQTRVATLSYSTAAVTTVFAITSITILVGSALANPGGYPDPFTPYDALRPGQPISVLEAYPCNVDYSADLYNNACSIYPTNEVISKVTVTKWNDKIRTVTFYSDNLQVIDVVRHWGKPDHVIKNGAFFITTWEQGITIYTIAGLHYRLSYQLPAWLVTLSE